MHRALLVVLLCPAVASADIRLDTEPIPDLFALEAAFHLDRGQSDRSSSGVIGTIGLGYGRAGREDTGTVASAIAAGAYTDSWLVLASSELVTANDAIWRGRHHALVEAHSEEDVSDGLGGSVAVQGTLEHGEARALAPIRLGQGRRTNADLAADALLHIGNEKDDFVVVAELFGEAGATRWESPLLDGAFRRSLGLGVGRAPADGELPRGSIDFLRGRVEHVTIHRPIIAAGSSAGIGDAEVRIAELGLGAHDMTLHIDHEILAVIEGDLGWSWMEADTAQGRIADNLFRMKLAAALKSIDEHSGRVRRLGLAIAREPGYTPDGQRLVADWRVDLAYAMETSAYVLAASGGISWPETLAGGAMPILPRYGSSIELFFKLGGGIEAGVYHATSYENQLAGDPWSADRTWATEAGVLARYRRDTTSSPRVRSMCGRY